MRIWTHTAILYRVSTGPEQGIPCVVFPHRENPVFISWDPCNENRLAKYFGPEQKMKLYLALPQEVNLLKGSHLLASHKKFGTGTKYVNYFLKQPKYFWTRRRTRHIIAMAGWLFFISKNWNVNSDSKNLLHCMLELKTTETIFLAYP